MQTKHAYPKNILSLHQWTPLHCAADKGNADIVKFLSDKVPDVNIKDKEGVSCNWCAM